MAGNGNVSRVYIEVIDDVINKVRDSFTKFGAGEPVLNELQSLWEMKMMQCGAISGNIERPPPRVPGQANPVHDLNVPYEGPTEEYETPTAEMLFPPTPLQTPIQTPLPGMEQGMYNIPTGPSDYAPSPLSDMRNGADIKSGRPNPYMPPPSPWMNNRPLGVDVNVAYVEGREDANREGPNQHPVQDFFMPTGKRKRDEYPSHIIPGNNNSNNNSNNNYMPQQDGSADVIIEFEVSDNQIMKSKGSSSSAIPQRDGVNDEYDLYPPYPSIPPEDYNNIVNTPAEPDLRVATPSAGSATPKGKATPGGKTPGGKTPGGGTAGGEDEEPPLNEDDDDDDDSEDLEQGDDDGTGGQPQHLVLAQFDKVTRTKNRWKCTLKDGIMHLNGKDILFNKAMGEFDF
ncbi:hypothetical protein LUZ60_012937 [Juncus effusus]|nr:hypothetical protein LUZ60_012937 [Juncus effusus]